ncbi:MAG: phosphate ABC transporter permease PstA [Deltaproteobacteria bacterium]|nr:MAG: phosphate ABC transporter permease PstA [Deltaproteobacteria bacterium]
MNREKTRMRVIKDWVFVAVVVTLSFLAIVPLVLILSYIVKNGLSSLTWEFLVELPRPVGEKGGGVANAIVGSFLLVIIASLPAIPLGVSAGIYLSEREGGRLSFLTRLAVEVLHGTPSIVIGIIAYLWLVIRMGRFSALSGGIALGIMMLPVIVRTTEETLKLIPDSLKEASLALGVPYHRTILKVILPAGLGGIMTGVLISVARIAGETAPLLFTAFGNPFMTWNIIKPVNALPLVIYNYATSPYPEWHAIAWGASCVLVGLVLALNLTARIIARRWEVKF